MQVTTEHIPEHGTFVPIDLELLAELTTDAVAAASAGDSDALAGATGRIDDIGGTFAASWALAARVVGAAGAVAVRAELDGDGPPVAFAAIELANATLAAAGAAGRVFDVSALYVGADRGVSCTACSVLASLAADVEAS